MAEKVNAGFYRRVLHSASQLAVYVAGQGAHADPYSLLKTHSVDTWAYELNPSSGRMWPGLMIYIVFYIMWISRCSCVPWPEEKDGTSMHYGKKANMRRKCDALGSNLLGKLVSYFSCVCYFDTYHPPKCCCNPSIPLFGRLSLQYSAVSSVSILLHCKNSLGMVWFSRSKHWVQGVDSCSKFPSSQYQLGICRMWWTKQVLTSTTYRS